MNPDSPLPKRDKGTGKVIYFPIWGRMAFFSLEMGEGRNEAGGSGENCHLRSLTDAKVVKPEDELQPLRCRRC